MGLYQDIKVAPFIQIPVQWETQNRDIRTCGKHECRNNDIYCPKCGGEVKTQSEPFCYMVSCHDLLNNDNFYGITIKDRMYIFSNKTGSGIQTDVDILTIITPELIEQNIANFVFVHKDDIRILESKINQKVKVEFGFINHIS